VHGLVAKLINGSAHNRQRAVNPAKQLSFAGRFGAPFRSRHLRGGPETARVYCYAKEKPDRSTPDGSTNDRCGN
jgi:hypothetical protein